MNKLLILILTGILVLIFSCTNSQEQKKQQYISMGRLVYQKQCTNCHQDDGKGMGELYPNLNTSHKLRNNAEELFCLIKYGSVEQEEGQEITMKMPAFEHLREDELAKVMSYITNAFGQQDTAFTDLDAQKALENCR